MIRVQWYPQGNEDEIRRFLAKLLDLDHDDKITVWPEWDEEKQKWFYEIRMEEQ